VIAIVDYGASNLRSVVNAFAVIGEKTFVTNDPVELANASAIVLPGVGAFGEGINALRRLGMVQAINEQVLSNKKPFLGICLGLQFLAHESTEHGTHQGFGWIHGVVRKIHPQQPGYRIPHMGWNSVHLQCPCPLFNELPDDPEFYFAHSYCLEVAQSDSAVVTSTCWHGESLTASIRKGHICAVQFHPEKSQNAGLMLLHNFTELIRFEGARDGGVPARRIAS